MREEILAITLCVICMSPGARGIKCFVGVQECHCGWNCTGIMSMDQVNAMNGMAVNKTCQLALRQSQQFPVRDCPQSDDVCLYVGNIYLAPYLDHQVIGRARIGNCFRKGVGSTANQSTYYPVFPHTDDSRKMQNWRFSVGTVDVTKRAYLCSKVEFQQRWTNVDSYWVRCFCYRDLCNVNLATVGAVKDLHPDDDVDEEMLDLNSTTTNEPKLIFYQVNTTTTSATDSKCGHAPDSEACEDAGTGARSAATHFTVFYYWSFYYAPVVLLTGSIRSATVAGVTDGLLF